MAAGLECMHETREREPVHFGIYRTHSTISMSTKHCAFTDSIHTLLSNYIHSFIHSFIHETLSDHEHDTTILPMIARRRIFFAVFPLSTEKSLATPQATPLIGTGSFGTSFGESQQTTGQDTVKAEHFWRQAVEYLHLPNESITLEDARQGRAALSMKWSGHPSQNIVKAVESLLGTSFSTDTNGQDLITWYIQEISRHYLNHQLPLIKTYLTRVDPLQTVLQLLQAIIFVYINRLARLVSHDQILVAGVVKSIRQSLHALVPTSLDISIVSKILGDQITLLARSFFGLSKAPQIVYEDSMQIDYDQEASKAQQQLEILLSSAQDVGLGGCGTQRIFAEVMNQTLNEVIRRNCANRWTSPSHLNSEISDWIDKSFAPFITRGLARLNDVASQDVAEFRLSVHDTEIWKTRAVNELGCLRLKQLFDLVVSWDDSRGAIEDLKQYVNSTNARSHVTTQFSEELSRRLLQPGASTSEILDLYIRLIQAFIVLDPRGVLLDRVARPIRRYLRERDDTVKLIVGGLLSDPTKEVESDPLSILAVKLEEATQTRDKEEDADLDWDDMNWVPDPIDAEPEYKKSKSSDIIGNLISLFETRDVFVKEFQNILGERLLQVNTDFDAETRLLELLKIRFGESPLQSCEVMLRDVSDSIRTDNWVRKEQAIDIPMDISTKVLSRLFWPALHTESFKLPPEIERLQNVYSAGYEKYKTARKLTWLDVLGEVTVELELEDRTITEVVKTPQAALIYAFTGLTSSPVQKTAEQLVEELQMDEDLVENCLLFWVGKLVLTKLDSEKYTVLERLPTAAYQEATPDQASKSTTLAAAAAIASASAAPVSALRSEEDIAEEKMQIYWQFIVGMLTNQGTMALPRIVMMLKLAMAGGFPYTNEELRTFLSKRVEDGKLELVGGNYKLVKGAV